MSTLPGTFFRKVVQHDFYDTADQVSAVVLVNSMSNGSWEYEEYLRLLRVRRFSQQRGALPAAQCYFVCADGAYPRIRAYIEQHQERRPHLRQFLHVPVCDAVIGDMDSYGTKHPHGCELPPSAPADGYATVGDIPSAVLDLIHERCSLAVAEFSKLNEATTKVSAEKKDDLQTSHKARRSFLPFWLHVRCQESTDFMKALYLIVRLRERYPKDAVVVPPPVLHTPSGLELLKAGGNLTPGAKDDGMDLDPERERSLCTEASVAEPLLLPTYVVLGALGGRIDHELGVLSTILSLSKEAHVVLTNQVNTIFACQPNGWTQVMWQSLYENVKCGLINFGTMKECETSGLRWNIVIGRGKSSETKDFALSFGKFISICNEIRREVVTIDLRSRRLLPTLQTSSTKTTVLAHTTHEEGTHEEYDPLVLFTIERSC